MLSTPVGTSCQAITPAVDLGRLLSENKGGMTESERSGLRGPVHTCRNERVWYSRKCGADACETEERGDFTVTNFRADGSVARRWVRNWDGTEWTVTYECDDVGRLKTVHTEHSAGSPQLQRYEYDSAGRLVRVVTQREGCADRVDARYEHQPEGGKTKIVDIDLAAHDPNTMCAFGVEGTDSSYSARGAARLTTVYNAREQPSRIAFHDAAGGLLSSVDFSYDSNGRLIEEAQTNVAEVLPAEMRASMNEKQMATVLAMFGAAGEPLRRIHRYDEQGRRCETISRPGIIGENRRTMAFNEHGDEIAMVDEHNEREYGIDEDGQLSDAPTKERTTRSEARMRYEYDTRGNWIAKRVECRNGPDEEYFLSTVEHREIIYFE